MKNISELDRTRIRLILEILKVSPETRKIAFEQITKTYRKEIEESLKK